MSTSHTEFMRALEEDFRSTSGLFNRAAYKLFYGQVRPAPILTLGINPGGSPAEISADGTRQLNGAKASASASYFEKDENDVLDCEWKENTGLRALLYPLVSNSQDRFRAEIVKSNLAFRRSAKKKDIDIEAAFAEAARYVTRIIERVSPRLVVLTGVPIQTFVDRFASTIRVLAPAERDPGVKQVVFAASRVTLKASGKEATVVQVAHASQFSWIYAKYKVAERALALAEA